MECQISLSVLKVIHTGIWFREGKIKEFPNVDNLFESAMLTKLRGEHGSKIDVDTGHS